LSSKFNVLIKASRAVITPCLTPCPNFNYPTLFELGNIIALWYDLQLSWGPK
jgi:hypothetical protein